MIAVVSQAWTLDADGHAKAYIAVADEFLGFMAQQPGFLGRRLLRGVDDPTHFTNIRLFDRVESYRELTQRAGYQDFITRLSEHLDLSRYSTYPREFMEVVLDDDPVAGAD